MPLEFHGIGYAALVPFSGEFVGTIESDVEYAEDRFRLKEQATVCVTGDFYGNVVYVLGDGIDGGGDGSVISLIDLEEQLEFLALRVEHA